jgi:hypothetical protein
MRHEVVELMTAMLAVSVCVQRSQQRTASLNPHAQVQRPTLGPVAHPRRKLPVTDTLLRLGDGSATDAAQHQFMPDFL